MTCVTKQQTITLLEQPEFKESELARISEQIDQLDEDSIKYRKYLAQKEALRQLEQIKSSALVDSHRMSFNR